MWMSPESYDYLKMINAQFSDQIRLADQKAAYVFTFLLALLIWSSEARKIFLWERMLSRDVAPALLSLALLVSLVVALLSAALVVLPRVKPGGSALYWGAWPAAGERFRMSQAAGDADFVARELMTNAEILATICKRKYRLVGIAIRALIFAILSHILSLVVG